MQPRIDQMIVVGALALFTSIAWFYLVLWPMPMPDGAGVATVNYAVLTTLMWFLMMIAMMAPSVTPVVLLFHRVARQGAAPLPRTLTFAAGYFCAWLAFSIAVSLLQIVLIRAGSIDTMGVARHRLVTALLLVTIGIYQYLPVKASCLNHCRSPVEQLTHHYRPGLSGAWRMGAEHGLYCVGCCWLLMLLLFIGGVMNLAWIAGITILVGFEKLLPRGALIAKAVGMLAIVAGLALGMQAA